LLAENPGIYPFISKVKKAQKCVLTTQNTLYFKETEDSIKILVIFDTRQNPETLANLI